MLYPNDPIAIRNRQKLLNEGIQGISSGGGTKLQEKFKTGLSRVLNDRQISQIHFRGDDIVSVVFSMPLLTSNSIEKISKISKSKIVNINASKGILTVDWEV